MTVAVDLGSGAVKVVDSAGSPVVSAKGIDPELTARVGTTVPLIRREGGSVITLTPHDAYVRAVATALAGTTAEFVAILAPDWWSKRARDVAQRTLEAHASGPFQLVSPALSAVRATSVESHDLPASVAVLDIGAESSSSTIVSDVGELPHVVGNPMVLHGRAGNDIDRRLMQHVLGWLGADDLGPARTDAGLTAAGQDLLAQVKAAKERLSARPSATLTTDLLGARAEVRLVRSDADAVVRETVDTIVAMLRASIQISGVEEVEAVLLIGGSVSIPLVTQVISVELGLPVILDDDPATLAVRGAATTEIPVVPARRGWRRHHRGAGAGLAHPVFDLDNAPWPDRERYVDPLPSVPRESGPAAPEESAGDPDESVLAPAPAPETVLASVPETVPADDDWADAVGQRTAKRLDELFEKVGLESVASRPEPELEQVRLVVETGPGPRPTRTATWTSAREGPGWKSARRARVDDEGQLRMWVNDRDYEVSIGTDVASTTVTLILMGLHVFVTASETGQLLREMRLNPDHDFRPE